MNRTARTQSGFTLLETLVAISFTLAIILVAGNLLDDLSDSRRRTQDRIAVIEGSTIMLDLLAARLSVATAADAAGESGIVGDAWSLRVTGSGVMLSRLAQGASLSPLVDRGSLEFEPQGEGLAIREGDGPWTMLIPSLTAIRFRYHDGGDWRDSWDSGTDGLPVAVEAAIWTDPWLDDARAPWMPAPEGDEIEFADGLADEMSEFGDFLDPDPMAFEVAADDEIPPPDRIRVIAILDPNPSGSPQDEFSQRPFDAEGGGG
ncbi:MAG: hypothetical protein CMJ23_06930 [Phycisphaerae bacterium]|nr:hypothetical protein [Phycisphaerae bacterium]